MAIITIGIDLAKNVFAVHGVDESGKPALVRPEIPRAKLLGLIASLPAMPDRHGSLLRRAPLGQGVCRVRHGTAQAYPLGRLCAWLVSEVERGCADRGCVALCRRDFLDDPRAERGDHRMASMAGRK